MEPNPSESIGCRLIAEFDDDASSLYPSVDVSVSAAAPVGSAMAAEAVVEEKPRPGFDSIPERFLILVTCRDEKHQVELLERFQTEGLTSKALLT
jgi:hypothetical protein